MKNSKNKGFRNTFLIGSVALLLIVSIGGGLIYSIVVHSNFDHFAKKGVKKEIGIQEEEIILDDKQPEVKVIHDTVKIIERCEKNHCEESSKKPAPDSVNVLPESPKAEQ